MDYGSTTDWLYTGCIGMNDKTKSKVGGKYPFLGVVCMDINFILSMQELQSLGGYDDFNRNVINKSMTCPG